MRPALWKRAISSLFDSCGLEVRRKGGLRADAFQDQVDFLAGKEVRTIFDVGAFVGDTAVTYAKRFPEARVYAFEPFPESFQTLKDRTAQLSKILPQQVAVAECSGLRRLHLTGHASSNSLMTVSSQEASQLDSIWFQNRGSVDVPVVTLDEFCEANGIKSIDVLKIDVQGAETAVLFGAEKLLTDRVIKLIYTEVICSRIYESPYTFSDLLTIMEKHRYRIAGVYNLMYFKRRAPIGQFDVIFMREDILTSSDTREQ